MARGRLARELRPYIHCAAACNFQERLAGMFDPQGPSHSARGSRDRVLPPPSPAQPQEQRDLSSQVCLCAMPFQPSSRGRTGAHLPQNGTNNPSRGSTELHLCLPFRHCIPFSCLHNASIAFLVTLYLVISEFISFSSRNYNLVGNFTMRL